jgi:elongation factor P
MINATELKNGTTFMYYGKPLQVIKYTHIKVGRGGAIVKVNVRNIKTGSVENFSFSSDLAFDEANTLKRKLQFLYSDSRVVVFMDPKTFEQVELPIDVLGDQIKFVKEGENVDVLFLEDQALSVELPPKITLKVAQTDPGVKGNSATNIFKPAILENGFKLKVPLFIKVGDIIRVDTRTGSYVERAK